MVLEIVFAAGCFWGVEYHFSHIPGVIDTKVGYSGGNYENPTYEDVLNHKELSKVSKVVNHTEAVLVRYDSSKVATVDLIKFFWTLHDPTQLNRQGNDIGNNYRSSIFYTTKNQYLTALITKDQYQKLLNKAGYGKIVTQIEPLKKFWSAEEYHQKYLVKNPGGYCPTHTTGVQFAKTDIKEFYKQLAELKWEKDSLPYQIAFNSGTERSFCQQYDIFKNTPDGVFVDALSDEILFDTKDRFDSGSGWLSFTKARDGTTVEKVDKSYGMIRTEVLAKESGMHLGHVFDEGSRRRFCINANVLDFVKREDLLNTKKAPSKTPLKPISSNSDDKQRASF